MLSFSGVVLSDMILLPRVVLLIGGYVTNPRSVILGYVILPRSFFGYVILPRSLLWIRYPFQEFFCRYVTRPRMNTFHFRTVGYVTLPGMNALRFLAVLVVCAFARDSDDLWFYR